MLNTAKAEGKKRKKKKKKNGDEDDDDENGKKQKGSGRFFTLNFHGAKKYNKVITRLIKPDSVKKGKVCSEALD